MSIVQHTCQAHFKIQFRPENASLFYGTCRIVQPFKHIDELFLTMKSKLDLFAYICFICPQLSSHWGEKNMLFNLHIFVRRSFCECRFWFEFLF